MISIVVIRSSNNFPAKYVQNHVKIKMLTFCPQMLDTTYIYNRAQQNLKQGAFPLLSESQAIIDIHDLSESKKQQILYKHLK
ncbi:conserved hypothetical protein [Photorhabdus asymbiotica]|uniref:Novel STAND NTPase 3 domain-containing protein n=1 Tax=Photorhabdus asymbiotica subsp. asymbiotica (strain ATCC 43949 / 3105-77) TaxID=553480 RepID=B6VNM0_PHOAA|nr:conserved hypothetical protein [Photorhabdus asymbiotica]CAR67750.1 Hypothetical protein PA-RVA20-21-0144 [Photorhabdus asymbiotica subsp. asymbiotica ATCC 43949]